ncbi:MAG: hypothetical protein HZC28_20365 [Spirochaetes bacterium]|nr:hypothetical protein [Spirochaetota bacterium]
MKNRLFISFMLASVTALIALTGCGKNPLTQDSATAGIEVTLPGAAQAQTITVESALIASGEATIVNTATGESLTKSAPAGSTIRFNKLLPGNYTVTVKMLDAAGNVLFEGTSPAAVAEGVTIPVKVAVKSKGGTIGISVTVQEMIMWNTLDNAFAVANSEIGPNGIITGNIQFESAVYGGGAVRKDTAGAVLFPGSIIDTVKDRGTFEAWIVPKISTLAPFSYGAIGIFNGNYGWDNDIMLTWGDSDATGGLTAYFYFSGEGQPASLRVKEETPFVATIGQAYHIAMVWDRSGIDGSTDTVRVLRDGVIIASSTQQWATGARTLPNNSVAIGGCGPDGNNYDKVIVDNVKIYNYAKSDFSNRFQE